MSTPPDRRDPSRHAEHLERLIGQVLREQPARRAPPSLEARVLAAIGEKSALPWWRTSFLHWPIGVRAAFLLASVGIVKAVLSAAMWLFTDERSAPVVTAITKPLSWAESIANLLAATARACEAVMHAIPSTWLYAGVAGAAALYVALFVLGAAAYRTLYVNK